MDVTLPEIMHDTNYHVHIGIHINNIILWPKDPTVNYIQEVNCCISYVADPAKPFKSCLNILTPYTNLCEENSYLNRNKTMVSVIMGFG